ncbi:MAG: hypothetical protein HY851_02315 [candidate division Zixibacteria bacterium]|nr:hypothetical protein [candidate division Zixibacteria bacterium]
MYVRTATVAVIIFAVALIRPCLAEPFLGPAEMLINSARANGMGGCVTTIVDEQSALYNPAALAVFHLDKSVSVAFPSTSEFVEGYSGSRLGSWSMGAGVSTISLFPGRRGSPHMSIAAAYSQLTLRSNQYSRSHSLGFAIDYFIRLGVGYSYKKLKVGLPTYFDDGYYDNGRSHDWGFYGDIDLMHISRNPRTFDSTGNKAGLSFIVAFAYVRGNAGGIEVTGPHSYFRNEHLEYRRSGQSIAVSKWSRRGELVSFRLVRESEEQGSFKPPGELMPRLENWGGEFGLFGAAFLRLGHMESWFFENPGTNMIGFGFSFASAYRWLIAPGNASTATGMARLINRIDIRADFSNYTGDKFFASSWHTFNLTMSL